MLFTRIFLAISMVCVAQMGQAKSIKKTKSKVVAEKENSEGALLKKVTKKYSAAKAIKMDVRKTLVLAMLNRTNVSEGFLAFADKKNFRLEFEKPVKSLVIVNEKQTWAVDYPAEGVEDKVHVTRAKTDKKNQSQVYITSLLGKGEILENFLVTSEEKKGVPEGIRKFLLKPKKESEEISRLAVSVDIKSDEIVELSWWDNLDNQTQMAFSNIDFKAELPKGFFSFTPPKGAEITDL